MSAAFPAFYGPVCGVALPRPAQSAQTAAGSQFASHIRFGKLPYCLSSKTGVCTSAWGPAPHQHGASRSVAAKDALKGASTTSLPTAVDNELIVLGWSPDASVTVSSVAQNGGCPVQPLAPLGETPSTLLGQRAEPSSHVDLLSGQALPQSLPRPVPQPLAVGAPDSNRQDSGLPRPMFVTSSTAAPVLAPAIVLAPPQDVAAGGSAPSGAANDNASLLIAQTEQNLAALQEALRDDRHASPVAEPQAKLPAGDEANSNGEQQAAAAAPAPGLWDRIVQYAKGVQWVKLWALALLSVSYIHQATTGFALPAMLPMISNELHLSDMQGALLTTGYSYLYAVALVPIGILADRVSRPKLLAGGLALWSLLTITASSCRSFTDLMLARVGFAAAQGAQNPVCFSLIPELFPVNKSTALALYNCALYVGRALSFGAVLLARHLHDNDQAHLAARGGVRVETRLDHLDRADLHSMSIMHTKGDMAGAAPDKEFNFPLWEYGSELPDAAWRQVLRWIAIPGFLIGLAMMFTLQEPRQQAAAAAAAPAAAGPVPTVVQQPKAAAASAAAAAPVAAPPLKAVHKEQAQPAAAAGAKEAAKAEAPADSSSRGGIWTLLCSKGFMSVTLAAALNDVGSYALIAWQSTFYERVYGLESSAYAPVLAALLPIGGILGGVGGGLLADRLGRHGRRWWVTGLATCLAAPFLAASCLAPSPQLSYAAVLVGFALSEMWRAPSAVMARGIAPASMGSTASALYLCVRNLVGGIGPLLVAWLIGVCGLQQAMLVVPAMYLGSGAVFLLAEKLYDAEMTEKAKAAAA